MSCKVGAPLQQLDCSMLTRAADFGSWSQEDVALGQAMAGEWKQLRDMFWSKPGAIVKHLLPPLYPPSSFPDFMPQLRNDATGGAGWDAMQALSPSLLDSVIFVFRANLGADTITVFPRALLNDTAYVVASTDFGWEREASGAELMAEGVSVAM